MAINAANFASGAMPTVEQAKQFGTTPGLTADPSSSPASPAGVNVNRGAAATFDTNTYQIEQQTYPNDLMSSEYGGNFVIFYINVAEDSKLAQNSNNLVAVSDVAPRDNGLLAATAQQSPTTAAVLSTTTVAVSSGTIAGGAISGLGGNSRLAVAAGILTGIGTGVSTAALPANFIGQKRRIKTAIALHTPNTLSIKYGMNYEEADLNIFGGVIAGTNALSKAFEKEGMSNIAAMTMAAGLNAPGTAGVSKLTGLAANPRKEQIFKWVDFRTFQFDYQFFPRDAGESQNVLEIIKQFKYHMHPEFKDADNFLYIYPSEFDIMHYVDGAENLKLNRYTSSVLTDMSVDYTPNAQFNSFEGGMPTQINISLTFKELAVLTKNQIQDGL